MAAGPDTHGVLSKQAEVAFKLLVLLMSVAGAGFAASQLLAGKDKGPATAAQVEQLSAAVQRVEDKIDAFEARVRDVELKQAHDDGAREAVSRERGR